jgi:serine O-acetyltransferase
MNDDNFITLLYERNFCRSTQLPDKQLCADFIESIFSFLFTPDKSKRENKETLQRDYDNLRSTFSTLLFDIIHEEESVEQHTRKLFEALPALYQMLLHDAEAIVQFDPAARSIDEVLIAYPGFFATAVYRISHRLHLQGIPTLPRLFSEYAHSKTGIDIHPGAAIGKSFFVDHGTGIVIGETTQIGNRVKIYQGVTIGALNVTKEQASAKRHPTIEDNVIIYSGATILGGTTVVGHDSVIGGNVWLTQSVAPYTVVYQKSEIVVRDKFPLAEPLNFII